MSVIPYPAVGKHNERIRENWAVAADGEAKMTATRQNAQNLEICTLFDQSQAEKLPAMSESAQVRPAGRWTVDLRPGRRKPGKDPMAVAAQRNLALERVRPVRNDLNDSDLEAVPVEVQPAGAPTAAQGRPFWQRWPMTWWQWTRRRLR
jgi:hypothetical protein